MKNMAADAWRILHDYMLLIRVAECKREYEEQIVFGHTLKEWKEAYEKKNTEVTKKRS